MAQNFYHILEASDSASQGALQGLFEAKRDRLQGESDGGDSAAKDHLWALRQAYETLSNPTRRAAYDQGLKVREVDAASLQPTEPRSEKLSWKLNVLIFALLASGLVGFGLYLGRANKKDDHSAQVLQTNRSADNDATRADTDRVLVEGVIKNDSKIIDRAAELGNRSLNVQQDAESRRRQELEYRANAGSQILDMQRQRQDRQLAMQEQQQKDALRQAEERKADREKQYWACMNAALDKMSGAAASARCAGVR